MPWPKHRSDEHKKKIAEALKGNQNTKGHKLSEEHKQKIGESNKGKHNHRHSDESRAKMSESQKKVYQTHSGPMKGKIFSDEHRRKISESLLGNVNTLGYVHSDETRRKISESTKGVPKSVETRRKMRGPKSLEHVANMRRAALNRQSFYVSKLELVVASWLPEFHHSYRIGKCVTDLANPELRIVIEVQGCYWHCCEQCGYVASSEWLKNNVEKDKIRIPYLLSKGFTVVLLWEHSIDVNNPMSLEQILDVGDIYRPTVN